jgi:ribosome-associated translation inhibitor RaiA
MAKAAHAALAAQDVQVLTRGRVPRSAVERVQEKIAALDRYCGEPILFTRVKINAPVNLGSGQLTSVQAVLDVNGNLIRAHAEGETAHAAVAELVDRLRARLDRVGRDWESTRNRRYRDLDRITARDRTAQGGETSQEPLAG